MAVQYERVCVCVWKSDRQAAACIITRDVQLTNWTTNQEVKLLEISGKTAWRIQEETHGATALKAHAGLFPSLIASTLTAVAKKYKYKL